MAWLLAIVFFFSSQPYFLWKYGEATNAIIILGCIVCCFVSKVNNKKRLWSILLFGIFYFYATIHQFFDVNIYARMLTLFPVLVFLVNEEEWKHIYDKYSFIYIYTIIPSLIIYLLVFWLSVDVPYSIISPLNTEKSFNYYAYPFLVMPDTLESIRFHGLYDEAGVVGNISGVLLVVNRCNMKNWKNWGLLLSGIFSFSLFFYIIVTIYILIFSSVKVKFAVFSVVFILCTFLLVDENPFSKLVLARLEVGDDGTWSGNNRTLESFDSFWSKFLNSSRFLYGYGRLYADFKADPGGQSYKHLIVDFGIIMFLCYIISFVFYYCSYKLSRKCLMLLLIILCSILFQRPFIFNLIYIFLLVSPAPVLKAQELKNCK